jgi:hypothetical protein
MEVTMKTAALLLAAAILAPAIAHAQFIARSLQPNDMIVGLTDVPCENDIGHQALRARGNWMQSGCYTVMPGPAVVVRWKDIGDMERIEMRDIEKTYAFKGWPTPDLTKAAARHQATVGGK